MYVIFFVGGRLGNAIFRYLATSIFSIKYGFKLVHKIEAPYVLINHRVTEYIFDKFIYYDKHDADPQLNQSLTYCFTEYYQHDKIYRKYKKEIIEHINNNNDYIYTDGIESGDANCQKFYMKDIINVPKDFNKIYKTVIHIRLGDKVNIGLTLSVDKVLNIIDKIQLDEDSCIVTEMPKNDYERNFLDEVKKFIYEKNKFHITIESNDILTDYYIMYSCEILVCSVSTISWAAALLSNNIKKCYMPDYPKYINEFGKCKYPIENTELYEI